MWKIYLYCFFKYIGTEYKIAVFSKLAFKSDHSSLQNHCNLLHTDDLKKITFVEFLI